MIIIVILTIIAFAWLYNTTDFQKLEDSEIAEIYGRTIHKVDVEKQLKVYELASILGEMSFLQDLGGSAPTPNAASSEFIWNLLVLQHESKRLGIQPTEPQIAAGILAIPALQNNGAFDRERYARLLQDVLAPRGMTERHLEDLVRDILRLERLRQIVTSPVTVGDAEVKDAFRGLQGVDAQFVKLVPPADLKPAVTPEEVEKMFNEQKANLVTPEYRSVKYVRFALPEVNPKLEGKARVDALQKLADQAEQLINNALAKGGSFEAAAAAQNLPVTTTAYFDPTGAGTPETPALPAGLPASLVQSAFTLSVEKPMGDIVQDGDALYVAQLQQTLASRPLTLEEARPQIEARLLAQKTQAAFETYAATKAREIREAVAAGKSFTEAAQAAGLASQSILNLSPFQQTPSPEPTEDSQVARATLPLEPGQISGFQPAPGGGFIVQLTQRAPLDPALFESQQAEVKARILETKQNLLFIEWLNSARTAADLKLLYQSN